MGQPVQRRRLREAVERRRTTPAALGEVAAVLGYADQAHFARVTDTTPGRSATRHAAVG